MASGHTVILLFEAAWRYRVRVEQNTNLELRYQIRLRDLRGWHLLTVSCGSCRHKAHLRLWQITDRRSPDEFLVDVERKLRCTRCGN